MIKFPSSILLAAIISFGILLPGCGSDDDEVTLDGELNVNFRMTYDGDPLVVTTESYIHDGAPIIIKRLSFFVSDMKMSNASTEVSIFDVEYINLTESHATQQLAEQGLTYTFQSVPTGTYNNLNYNIGVDETINTTTPADYTTAPLNNANEYWSDWNSFIFVKVEGALDFDEDGEFESNFAMHLGSENAFRSKSFSNSIDIKSGEVANLDFVIDVHDIFNNGSTAYDFVAVPRTHSLDFLDEINFVADGLARATSL